MSGFGRSTPRSWQRSPSVRSAPTRNEEADLEAEARLWAQRAVRLGFCVGCGAFVDEENGKLHDEHCIPAEPARCAKGQRS